jgi:hypothetical protein
VTSPAPSKASFFQHVLESENVLVHIDPRPQRVIVPKHLKTQKHTVLLFGYNMPVPINDLKIEENVGIAGTLSFNRSPFYVFVPWDIVFGLVGERTMRFMLWPDSLSADLAAEMARAQANHATRLPTESKPAPRTAVTKRPNLAGLRLVKNEK